MLKTAFLTFVVLCISIVGGGASVWYTLKANESVGAVTIGEWTAFPLMGTLDADPYSRARVAREGLLTLGRAEGLRQVPSSPPARGARAHCTPTRCFASPTIPCRSRPAPIPPPATGWRFRVSGR